MPRVSMCEALEEYKDAQQTEEEIRFLSDYWHENWSWSRLATEEQRQIEQEKAKREKEDYDDLMMASIRLEEEGSADDGSFLDDEDFERETDTEEEMGDIYNPFMEAELERQRSEQDKEAWLSGRDL